MSKEKAGSQVSKHFEKKKVETIMMDYLLYLPEDYGKSEQKWPLMIFLHGAGERGSELEKVKVHGPPKLIEQGREFEFVIISPQCPQDLWWPEKMEEIIALLDEIESKYDIDTDRVYMTGLSMGGFGTWAVASKYSERFAAIAPICGGIEPLFAEKFKALPIWAFHGAKDQVVPLSNSARIVEEIKKVGGNAKLTVYPEAGHDSWTVTYENPQLYEWFLEHRISDRKKN
ncbi:MAG: prolyl oligopeptidase family serine peptidase [Sedimentisphaerales bacterium]|nr:prolyl oligopeptidase family serine peptidase [Sedimentisphaerales bacterium]